MTAQLFRRHAGRLVLLGCVVVLAVGVAVTGHWQHHPVRHDPPAVHQKAVTWWPYSDHVPSALRYVGVGPQGTYFAGKVAGLSPEAVAQRLLAVGWHSATILDGSKVVGGVTTDHGHRFAWGASS